MIKARVIVKQENGRIVIKDKPVKNDRLVAYVKINTSPSTALLAAKLLRVREQIKA